jgi:ABC-type dipeptide/oligopeptide/nickel transport system permease component
MMAVLQRIALMLLAFACAIFIIQSLIFLIPGDPALLMAGDYASAEDIAAIRRELALDRPFFSRYIASLQHLAFLDLGNSVHTGRPVRDLIFERFPATLFLAALSMSIAVVCGISLGIIAAISKGSNTDAAILWVSSLFISTPIFITCLLLALIFSHALGVLPPSGHEGYDIRFAILPSIALASRSLALIIRVVRNELLIVLASNYIKAARAMGIPYRRIVLVYALKNIAVPTATIVLLDFGAYLGGAVVTETVFAWPGIGRLLMQALQKRDLPLVQGLLIFSTGLFIIIGIAIEWIKNREKG